MRLGTHLIPIARTSFRTTRQLSTYIFSGSTPDFAPFKSTSERYCDFGSGLPIT